jgi:GDP-4-dehydro-6-deoxy-D-mannose reductase
VPALQASGREVVGAHLPGLPRGPAAIDWRACDLRDRDALAALVADVRPAEVLHLAALAAPSEAARDPLGALRSNYLALDHLLAALAASAPAARLLFASTGEVYGFSHSGAAAWRESDALAPASLYAATKVAGERRLGLELERGALDALIVRPFNHTGPGRPPVYAESAFAQQLARIERGLQEPVLRVGNLEAERDFSDVRDVAAAYMALLERGERGGVYNVASGRSRTIRSVLDALLQRSSARARVEIDPERWRPLPAHGSSLAGDASRLRALGWAPRYAFEDSLGELLDAWRASP